MKYIAGQLKMAIKQDDNITKLLTYNKHNVNNDLGH